jgi:hypothetical protein
MQPLVRETKVTVEVRLSWRSASEGGPYTEKPRVAAE